MNISVDYRGKKRYKNDKINMYNIKILLIPPGFFASLIQIKSPYERPYSRHMKSK